MFAHSHVAKDRSEHFTARREGLTRLHRQKCAATAIEPAWPGDCFAESICDSYTLFIVHRNVQKFVEKLVANDATVRGMRSIVRIAQL
jgi:hypothetical protein